jgi:hypothetical protein
MYLYPQNIAMHSTIREESSLPESLEADGRFSGGECEAINPFSFFIATSFGPYSLHD